MDFLRKIFMDKKEDQVSVQDQATEAVVESIVETKKETKHPKDCNCSTCLECLEWRK
jgi:nitrogen regulatory protein PII